MSIVFFDGFDFYGPTGFGEGGRKWDQVSQGQLTSGRFGGQALIPGTEGGINSPTVKTLPVSSHEWIVGFAIQVTNLTGIENPILVFYDTNTAQASLWIDPTSTTLTVRTGAGTGMYTVLGDTGFVPPIGLWFYLEIKMTIGMTGGFQINIDSTENLTVTGVQTQQSGNNTANKIELPSMVGFGFEHYIDDLYVVNTQDATNNVTFLDEVRVQTKYPDANGYLTDFQPSTGTNWQNVNVTVTSYAETGLYNYDATVNDIDAYSIQNFTISGTIFAVQENLSVRKDDVGNRSIKPLVSTPPGVSEYLGSEFSLYSSYTWAGQIWENNPNTEIPWILTDLNNAQFGLTVSS